MYQELRKKVVEVLTNYLDKLPNDKLFSADYDMDTLCRSCLNLPSRPSDDRVYGWLTPIQKSVTYTPDLTISKPGIDFIKAWEGLRLKAYRCPAGKWTIGYGHTLKAKAGQEITPSEAEILLRQDLVVFENAVRNLVKVQLTQNQFNALVSFTYNVGEGAFAKSSLLRLLNQGDYRGASQEFDRWIYANKFPLEGLKKRREAEKKMFLDLEIMNNSYIKKLPPGFYTGLSISVVILSFGLTISMIRSNSVDLAVANTRLQVSGKINQTTEIAKQLELQAIQLQQQQRQYLELKSEYDRLLTQTNGQALKELKPAIEEINPDTIALKEITDNLQTNQEELRKLVGQ